MDYKRLECGCVISADGTLQVNTCLADHNEDVDFYFPEGGR
jgi:hypothetical protein